MEDLGRWKGLDAAASVAVGLLLLVFGSWCGLEVAMVPRHMALFAEMNAVDLPHFTQLVWRASEFHLPMVAALILLLGGFACLFAIRDRFRANVYALIVALLMAALAVMVRWASWLPLFKVVQAMGQ